MKKPLIVRNLTFPAYLIKPLMGFRTVELNNEQFRWFEVAQALIGGGFVARASDVYWSQFRCDLRGHEPGDMADFEIWSEEKEQ